MLSTSHKRAYQDLLTLLTGFDFLVAQPPENFQIIIQQEFHKLQEWFEQNIANLSQDDLAGAIASRWQAVQTEIKREFKLLSTDILFLASARQNATQTKRLKSIADRLTKLIGYCQVMLKDSN